MQKLTITLSSNLLDDIRLLIDKARIRVAQYYTELPERKLLIYKLRKAIEIAKEKGLK